MSYIKKYMFLIICVVAFLCAEAALLAMGLKVNADNTKELGSIKSQCDKVPNLERQAVRANVLEQYKQNATLVADDAKAIMMLAARTTARPYLYDKVFPEPVDESSQVIFYQRFSDNYCRDVEKFIAMLNGGDRPTQIEETQVIEDHRKRIGDTKAVRMSSSSYRGGMSQDTPEAKLIADYRETKAGSISVYVNSDSFCAFDYWQRRPNEELNIMLNDTWYSQLAIWIQEDVVLSIAELNDPAKNVMENPVKRLIEITFNGNEVSSDQRASDTRSSRAVVADRRKAGTQKKLPCYVTRQANAMSSSKRSSSSSGAEDKGKLVGHIVEPWTGRSCDDLIDIVQFEVGVVIDTRRMMDFVAALQGVKYTTDESGNQTNKRNQITVLDMQLDPIDIEEENKGGYYYGSGKLGNLRLACEYAFYKIGYEKYKPEIIKEDLAGATEEDGGRR